MKNTKDRYNFSQSSRFQKPGFEIFEDKATKLHYFLFNDEEGESFLYSQGYRDRKSRDKAIKSVIRNAVIGSRYEKSESAGKSKRPYFILKAGNHQEIARSRSFDSKREMNAALKLLTNISESVAIHDASDTALVQEEKVKKNGNHKRTSPSPKKPLTQDKMARYRFTVTYYPDSKVWVLKNDFAEESKTFKQLDGEKFHDFLQAQVPEEIAGTLKKEAPAEPVERKAPTPAPPSPPIAAKPRIQLHELEKITFVNHNGEEKSQTITKKGFSEVRFEIPESLDLGEHVTDVHCNARVLVKSMDNPRELLIGEISDRLTDGGKFSIPVITNRLKEGLNRITLSVALEEKDKGKKQLHGGQLVMII